MFTTEDNAGYIRINYTTDQSVANDVNPLAKLEGIPLVYTPATMGGYRMPILEFLAEGANFHILKCQLPGHDKVHIGELTKVLKDSDTVYYYVDATTITIVQIEGWIGGIDGLRERGFTIKSGQKTFKRFKSVNRPFRFWWMPERPLRVAIVDDDSYIMDEELHELPDDIKERLLDGGFVISPQLYEECLNNVEFPTVQGEIVSSDGIRALEFRRRCRHIKTFNARIFGDFHYVGTDFDKRGQLKGQAFIDVSGMCERMKVDVIAARSAIKDEVSWNKTAVLLDPQVAKYRVNSDLQSINNNPVLFDPKSVEQFVKVLLLGALEDLKENKLMEHWYALVSPEFDKNNTIKFDQDDLISLTKWNVRTWIMSGMQLNQSPWLFEQMARNILSIIKTNDDTKMRIPIPCAVRCQVLSQSMASAAGEDFDIEPGQIRFSTEHEVLVVSDADWLEMYASHGGNDLDDFFVGYYRTVAGVRKVFVTRSPNDFGEYSIFDYVEGDWYPVEKLRDGIEVSFPKVSADPKLYPKRLSEAVRDDDVFYEGLPSSRMEPVVLENPDYGLEDFIFAVDNNVDSQACIGKNVNARTVWTQAMGRHRPIQLAPMEACIDTGAQGGCKEDIKAVTDEAELIIKHVFENSDAKIDMYLWSTRFSSYYNFDLERLTTDTHLYKIHKFRKSFARAFMKMAQEYVTKNVGNNVPPVVHKLGKRYLRKSTEILRDARRSIAQSRDNNNGDASSYVWEDIHSILDAELEMLNPYEQHDLMLGLYSACLKMPTMTTGKISDQLVMNPQMFDRLMAALRHYGIAAHLVINQHGDIVAYKDESWMLTCVGCGLTTSTIDPLVLQAYYAHNELCKSCENEQ